MTTTTLAPATPRDIPGPTLPRLVGVELRKATDTRSGRWLLALMVVLSTAVAVVRAFVGPEAERTLVDVVSLSMLPFGVFLPILGILLVTSEWSQRTSLTTFALVPDRPRVIRAKALAALTLCVIGLAAGLLVSVGATALAGVDGAWNFGVAELGQAVLVSALGTLWGLAFGIVLRSPAAAIVAYFALPTLFSVLGELVTVLKDAWQWLDPNVSLSELGALSASGNDWAHLATSCALWIAVPLVVGTHLLQTREVK